MSGSGFDGGAPESDFERLARQYWDAWGRAVRDAVAQAPATSETTGGTRPANAAGATDAGAEDAAEDAAARSAPQAGNWFARMQELAAQFAGKEAQVADIVAAWKQMLDGANPFADLIMDMPGLEPSGIGQWAAQAASILQTLQHDSWLGLPAFGFAREHQERWQDLGRAQLDYQEKRHAFHALMAEATPLALRHFERKLGEHAEPGRQIGSARALFDLWIDAAEQAYAEIALSARFRELYGALVNAQMRVRVGMQRELEQYCNLAGLPTRSEVDAAHRRIAQLERELRRLRDALQEREPPVTPAAAPKPAAQPAAGRAAKRAAVKVEKAAPLKKAAPRGTTASKAKAGRATRSRTTAPKPTALKPTALKPRGARR